MTQSISTVSPELAPPQNAPCESAVTKIARTIAEGFAMMVFSLFLMGILTALHANFFMPSQDQSDGATKMLTSVPALFFVFAVFAAPLLEELIFRGIPSGLMRLTTKPETQARRVVWIVFGLASALIFGTLHGLHSIGVAPHARTVFQTLPLPQFFLGLWAWRVATQRGLRYSMLLHATYNLITFMLSLAFAPKV